MNLEEILVEQFNIFTLPCHFNVNFVQRPLRPPKKNRTCTSSTKQADFDVALRNHYFKYIKEGKKIICFSFNNENLYICRQRGQFSPRKIQNEALLL